MDSKSVLDIHINAVVNLSDAHGMRGDFLTHHIKHGARAKHHVFPQFRQ